MRLVGNIGAQEEIFKDDYWNGKKRWKVRNNRDLFRLMTEFVIEARSKNDLTQASKLGKVMWCLGEAKVHPDQAASAIFLSGGIEKVAQGGIKKPVMLHPLDTGDGMTIKGEKIEYHDADDDEQEKEDNHDSDNEFSVKFLNKEKLIKHVQKLKGQNRKITLFGVCRIMPMGKITFTIESVTLSKRAKTTRSSNASTSRRRRSGS
jgi:hypothetical protein